MRTCRTRVEPSPWSRVVRYGTSTAPAPRVDLARKLVRRLWWKYVFWNVDQANMYDRIELAYQLTDPWHMDSELERFRFAETDRLIRERIAPSFESILEVGCGEGHQSEVLQQRCTHLTGIDVSPTALARARRRVPAATFASGDIYAQPWRSQGKRFELVTACELIYDIHDRRRFLATLDELGATCLVTYFEPAVRKVERDVMAMPGARRATFRYEDTEWIAVWWKGAAARAG